MTCNLCNLTRKTKSPSVTKKRDIPRIGGILSRIVTLKILRKIYKEMLMRRFVQIPWRMFQKRNTTPILVCQTMFLLQRIVIFGVPSEWYSPCARKGSVCASEPGCTPCRRTTGEEGHRTFRSWPVRWAHQRPNDWASQIKRIKRASSYAVGIADKLYTTCAPIWLGFRYCLPNTPVQNFIFFKICLLINIFEFRIDWYELKWYGRRF